MTPQDWLDVAQVAFMLSDFFPILKVFHERASWLIAYQHQVPTHLALQPAAVVPIAPMSVAYHFTL